MATGVAAFIGRTLKGPVGQAVPVTSFAEFQQQFGGLWQPSTLSYALEQFFENGGRDARIVRVVNGARPPTITLPAGGDALRLVALNPGSREYLRASVDYDGLTAAEHERFNLVVQRVRTAGSELVEDQEIYRRLSMAAASGRYVGDVLLQSRLVRMLGAAPDQRPDRSAGGPGGVAVGYTLSNTDGDDGAPLTDYDIIGSAGGGTGLFALGGVQRFNLLCIPPLARDRDVGLSTLLVAARFCRERHALLVVDPPASWTSAPVALDSLRHWPFRSDSAVMYYPRVQAFDRLRGRVEVFGSCGAAAGMIARADEVSPVWSAVESEEAILRPGLRPAVTVSDADRARLAQAGVNTLLAVRGGSREGLSPRTLAAGGSGASDWKYLSARRLALFIAASIEQGTRWVLLEHNGPATWQRARAQVEAFLESLAAQGAFAGAEDEQTHFVIADERVNRRETLAEGKFNLLFGFATSKPGELDTWLVTHRAGASRVRPVSVNRSATSKQRVEWEIETAILRGP
ncbi:MAG TPA: phage tail sheath C-terminal domain-containing protein [Steroidobacteraceae bacterium]|nr:phage tail sheath C-terminal domain-containing protein [Steroidobacteraceae bacterium]